MRILAIGAHAADIVNKTGGVLALHAERGDAVFAAALTYGERGESANLWKQPGATLEQIKAQRTTEINAAAAVLGAKLKAFDFGDHMIDLTPDRIDEIAMYLREVQPDVVITHNIKDILNPDHATTARGVEVALRLAATAGHRPEFTPIGRVERYAFEPNHAELMSFDANTYVDITSVIDKKLEAISCYSTQPHLRDSVQARAAFRGANATHASKREIKFAEAFDRLTPFISSTGLQLDKPSS